MPMPPSRASAIARCASVTVSIAELVTGMLSGILRVNHVRVSVSLGSTPLRAGTSRTSSNVRPSVMLSGTIGRVSGYEIGVSIGNLSPVEQPGDQRQYRAQNQASGQRKIKRRVLAAARNVARQPSQAEWQSIGKSKQEAEDGDPQP